MKGLKEFKKECLGAHPYEQCGLIYILNNEWNIVSVKTIPKDFDDDGFPEGFTPDKKDWKKKKAEIAENGGVVIGVIHSHPVDRKKEVANQLQPSGLDLKYQRMFKHPVRGIVVCSSEKVFKFRFHDANNNDVVIDTCPFCKKPLA